MVTMTPCPRRTTHSMRKACCCTWPHTGSKSGPRRNLIHCASMSSEGTMICCRNGATCRLNQKGNVMDFQYPPDNEAMQDSLLKFMRRHILPANPEWHRQAEHGMYPTLVV